MPKALKLTLLLIVMALLAAVALFITPLSRSYEALLLLDDIGNGGLTPHDYRAQKTVRKLITFTGNGQQFVADLYRTQNSPKAAIVLQHGAVEAGKDDVRLVRFAEQLARAGFLVMVPEMPGAKRLQVNSGDIPVLRFAVDYLQKNDTQEMNGPIGIAGFSVAAGLAIHAAMLPELRERISFILAVGGYYDLPQTLSYMTTGTFSLDGEQHRLEPNEYGKWVFVLSNVGRISDLQQRELLRQIATSRISSSVPNRERESQLSGEALAIYRYITNEDPQRSGHLMRQLPELLLDEIDQLDLANREFSSLSAKLLLVHGRDDNIIPYSQSVALQRALPTSQTQLYLLNNWTHVDPGDGGLDGWQMFRALYRLLELRDLKW